MSQREINLGNRLIGREHPCLIVAEISANHNGSLERALQLFELAAQAGVDAVKSQTYTADSMTLDCDADCFQIHDGPWKGQSLYSLYSKAATPYEWLPHLKKKADELGLLFFSSVFDNKGVDYLVECGGAAIKIASPELVDIPLIAYAAQKMLPMVMATGMANQEEVQKAVDTVRLAGNNHVLLLKCSSSYPAIPEEMNLKTIPYLAETFDVVAGLSDHSTDNRVALAAVSLGASMIEKHFTDSRGSGGVDSHFSMEPQEMAELVAGVRLVEKIAGTAALGATESEIGSLPFRRSLFAAAHIFAGETLTVANVCCIRPADGLAPFLYSGILGAVAKRDIPKGTPLSFDAIGSAVQKDYR